MSTDTKTNNKDVKHPQATGKSENTKMAEHLFATGQFNKFTNEGWHQYMNPTAQKVHALTKGSKKTKGAKKAAHVKVGKSLKTAINVLHAARALKAMTEQKNQTLLEQKSVTNASYFSMSSNSADSYGDKLKLIDMQISNLREVVRNSLGSENHYKVNLSGFTLFPSTVTTGVVNGVYSIVAGAYNDFTALSALFEEYQMVKGSYTFMLGSLGASATTTPSNVVNMLACMSYSISPTALVSAGQAGDDFYAKLYSFPAYGGTQGGSAIGLLGLAEAKPHVFHWKIPKGILASGPAQASEWLVTSDITTTWGYVKVYWVCCSSVVIANALSGNLESTFHFRNRV